MIKGLSTAGLGKVKNLEELIILASENGFGSVDTSGQELRDLVEEKGLENAKAFLKEHHVSIGSIGLPIEWRQSEEQFKEGLSNLLEDAKIAAEFGCTSCCTYVLPATDYNAAHFMVLATKRLRLCAQILKEYGINLGLEFVGPHHLRTAWKNPFIWEMKDTLDWIDAIGETNVGLLLDSYHWYTIGGTLEDLTALRPEQITHVHLNDAKDVPVEEVLDNDRLFPGEGVINLAGFLKALNQIGYKGSVTQEILTKEPLTESAKILAEKSGKAYAKVYAKADLQ
ncbi:sugar phosphate isomerase/epimerase family protein [Lederbergia wuyishanensis]|uniref:Sugar phosphate isomerase/epimerase n=1 Tax=Lederbergia wuyishanensis TaxID=1347903 RepID=A0ABU0D1Z1_9BACI|nr:sugar phosphate isomerase/epimerase family protein [Lederbergia wuyishanensis]MCJ8007030.1 sugar phosphate isomerase/epimerase [Lederbergia wuyishanensis]MDQ0342415.1 sugar phosphate isomerase/epimerase [Lederbergia wuyishanensis]